MNEAEDKIVKRLDALLGIALSRLGNTEGGSTEENIRYLRSRGSSNSEIANILGTTLHYVEVVASKLLRQGKIRRIGDK